MCDAKLFAGECTGGVIFHFKCNLIDQYCVKFRLSLCSIAHRMHNFATVKHSGVFDGVLVNSRESHSVAFGFLIV